MSTGPASNFSLTVNVFTTPVLNTEVVDSHSASVNGVFTCPAGYAGWYHIDYRLGFITGGAVTTNIFTGIYRNGALALYGGRRTVENTNAIDEGIVGSGLVLLAAGDTLDVRCVTGVSGVFLAGLTCNLSIHLVRPT